MIHGDIKEPLNLPDMKIHRQDAVGSGRGDQIGDQLSRNGNARFGFAILPAVPIIGNDHGDAPGRGAGEGVHHDQQFHDVVVHRRTRRLYEKDIVSADVLHDLQTNFSIRKSADIDFPQRDVKVFTNLLGQLFIGVS